MSIKQAQAINDMIMQRIVIVSQITRLDAILNTLTGDYSNYNHRYYKGSEGAKISRKISNLDSKQCKLYQEIIKGCNNHESI
jgi:hypothetical protein